MIPTPAEDWKSYLRDWCKENKSRLDKPFGYVVENTTVQTKSLPVHQTIISSFHWHIFCILFNVWDTPKSQAPQNLWNKKGTAVVILYFAILYLEFWLKYQIFSFEFCSFHEEAITAHKPKLKPEQWL